MPRLRERFPHLPLCVLMDSLHANEPMFAVCEMLDLRFLTVLTEGSLPTVYREFYDLVALAPENRKLLSQLFECLMGGKKKVSRVFGSHRNLAARLLDSLRTLCPLQGKEMDDFLNTRIQLRLDTS